MYANKNNLCLFALVSTLLVSACSGNKGGSPTAPSVNFPDPVPDNPVLPTSTVVSVMSAEHSPISGAGVILSGREVGFTNSSGNIEISEPPNGSFIDLDAPNFLKRETLYDTTNFSLMPSVNGFDMLIRSMIYHDGQSALRRVEAGMTYYIYMSSELRDAKYVNAHRSQAALASHAAGVTRFEVVTDVPPAGSPVFEMKVNPNMPDDRAAQALTHAECRSGSCYITRGTVEYKSPEYASNLTAILHELGHMMGLRHSNEIGLMHGSSAAYSYTDFTGREKSVVRMLFLRKGGNRYPDSDRASSGPSGAGGAGGVRVVTCSF